MADKQKEETEALETENNVEVVDEVSESEETTVPVEQVEMSYNNAVGNQRLCCERNLLL